jgi:dephospho-CoA kinase
MTQKTAVIAITGGIGSGKTLVSRLFESWGASIVDADLLARKVVEPGSPALAEIAAAFPSEPLILLDGSLNRSKLASIIFSDPEKRKKVEAFLHPRIRSLWLSQLRELSSKGVPIVCYVVPLFFESTALMPEIQKVVLVSAPEEVRLSRIMQRDGFSRDIAELRLRAQMPDSQKIPRSDFVIINDSTVESATAQAKRVFNQLRSNT